MKSIKELEEIRQRTLNNINMRKDSDSTRIVVGMATCGIAAGARPVLLKFCRLEPIVEIYAPNSEKVTYVKVTPDKASRIITEHIVNGKVVEEYTIGWHEANENK